MNKNNTKKELLDRIADLESEKIAESAKADAAPAPLFRAKQEAAFVRKLTVNESITGTAKFNDRRGRIKLKKLILKEIDDQLSKLFHISQK